MEQKKLSKLSIPPTMYVETLEVVGPEGSAHWDGYFTGYLIFYCSDVTESHLIEKMPSDIFVF